MREPGPACTTCTRDLSLWSSQHSPYPSRGQLAARESATKGTIDAASPRTLPPKRNTNLSPIDKQSAALILIDCEFHAVLDHAKKLCIRGAFGWRSGKEWNCSGVRQLLWKSLPASRCKLKARIELFSTLESSKNTAIWQKNSAIASRR